MALQLALLLAARARPLRPASCPLRIAYYYVTVTASIAVGLFDRIRAGAVPIGWEKVEGTDEPESVTPGSLPDARIRRAGCLAPPTSSSPGWAWCCRRR